MKQTITSDDLVKMTHSKYVITEEINIKNKRVFHDEKYHKLVFDIYDGLALCPNYQGKSYIMEFPKEEFIKVAPNMQESIRKYLKLDENQSISITDILHTYGTLKEI